MNEVLMNEVDRKYETNMFDAIAEIANLPGKREDKLMKYETYEEVIQAYATGELDREKDIMWMDNDCCGITLGTDDEDDEGEVVFRGGGQADIIDLARAAGIPCESV